MGLTKCILSKLLQSRTFTSSPRKPPWKVLFFGADEFSIYTLKALTHEYRIGRLVENLEVVTTIKGKPNAVKLYSEQEKLMLHKWPPSLIPGKFDVGLVVSFGHLIPRSIIEQFEMGMLNVHASLLPRWRGASPIIYALANGDTKTGVTVMKINPEKFDTGEIVRQEAVPIPPAMKMSELHRILGEVGAKNLVITLEDLPLSLKRAKPQPTEGVTYAPKITSNFACVKWDEMTSKDIHNLSRALDGVFHLQTTWSGIPIKLINVDIDCDNDKAHPGCVKYDKQKKVLKVGCADSKFITVEKIGVFGKKIMTSKDFINGYIKKEPPDCRYFK